MKIVNIRRWPDKPYVYAELRDNDDSLIISATLDYILGELKRDHFKDRLEAHAYEKGIFCRNCQQRVWRRSSSGCGDCDHGDAPLVWVKGRFHFRLHTEDNKHLYPCEATR